MILLWKKVYSGPLIIFNWTFMVNCMSSFYILNIIRYVICKYLLPFSRLPFNFVKSFLGMQKLFGLSSPFVYFCFCFPCLRRHNQKKKNILLWSVSKRVLPMLSSRSFKVQVLHLGFKYILNLFLHMVWESNTIWLFYMKLSNFPNTVFWRNCIFFLLLT